MSGRARRRVVVTGLGCVTPLGLDASSSWDAVLRGVPGERLVLRWEDDGCVELELDDAPAGTRVLVRETSPDWGVALELEACAAWAIA